MNHKYFEINKNGCNIRCKTYFNDKNAVDTAVVFCAGFASHKDNAAAEKFAEKMLSKYKKAAVIVFDWPAHGDDVKKRLSLSDCDTYLGLVTEEVLSMYGGPRLFAYSASFGAYLTLKYIHEHGSPFCRIALRCPAVCMHDTMTNNIIKSGEYDKLIKGKDAAVGFDRKVMVDLKLLEDLKTYDVRKWDYLDYAEDILIIHGDRDEIVPYEEGRKFAEDNIIEFITIDGADHRFHDPVKMSLAIKHILEFFGIR